MPVRVLTDVWLINAGEAACCNVEVLSLVVVGIIARYGRVFDGLGAALFEMEMQFWALTCPTPQE